MFVFWLIIKLIKLVYKYYVFFLFKVARERTSAREHFIISPQRYGIYLTVQNILSIKYVFHLKHLHFSILYKANQTHMTRNMRLCKGHELCAYCALIVRLLCGYCAMRAENGSSGKYAKMTEKMPNSCKFAIFLVILHDF